MTTATEVEELSASDLGELGIDVPREMIEAYRTDAGTITLLVPAYDGCHVLDAPNVDNSGEDAWEWIAFDNGRERDDWRLENSVCASCGGELYWDDDRWFHSGAICNAVPAKPALAPTDILIERYEHGLVNYAPIGEASQVDRRWDVAHGVAVIRFLKPDAFGDRELIEVARSICEEYTYWCNGDAYGLISFERRSSAPAVLPPFMTADDFDMEWVETDSCWGFLGYEYAVQAAKEGL